MQYIYSPISQEIKLYQLLCSCPPYAIQVKITTVILKGGSLTEHLFINLFNQLKGENTIFLGVPPHSLFFSDCDSRIRFSKEYAAYT